MNVNEIMGPLANYAMGFEYFYSQDMETGMMSDNDIGPACVSTSILLSKQTGRYRVQSDHISGIQLIMAELEKRLVYKLDLLNSSPKSQSRSMSGGMKIICNDNLPLDGFFQLLHKHFNSRVE